jgi:hypothetical protein
MTNRGKAMAGATVGFVAILLYGTLASQKASCSVVMEFAGARDSATASAESVAAAEQQAKTTACATISQGMNDRIACAARPPVVRRCDPPQDG